MAKVNFRQLKRQKEIARKQRQDERLARRTEKPESTAGEQPVVDEPKPVSEVS